MFDKLKKLLSEIEKTGIEKKEKNEEKLKTILSTISKIEEEILELKKRTQTLLD